MSELRELYQEMILDHGKNPRNRCALEGADERADGNNPLCGDKITIFVKTNGETVEDVTFEGTGCAISTASASMMTEAVTGMRVDQALRLCEQMHTWFDAQDDAATLTLPESLQALGAVREHPARRKCVLLSWEALAAAIAGAAA